MDKDYSLNLPQWGPYNKVYLGAAHVADRKKGLRFDLNLFPGYFRRSVMSARDIADSGIKMMGASKKLSRFIYRYELEWKDKVYLEADFSSKDNVLTVKCNFVNNTDRPENLSLNVVMSMKGSTSYHQEIIPCGVNVNNGFWVDALDYCDIKTSRRMAYDGLYLCEGRGSGFVCGSFLNSALFESVSYTFKDARCNKIGVRYRLGGKLKFRLNENEYNVVLPYSEDLNICYIDVEEGEYSAVDVFPVGDAIELDGFIIGGDVQFFDYKEFFMQKCENTENGVGIIFGDMRYTLKTDCENFVVRNIKTNDIGRVLTSNVHNHIATEFNDGDHQYTDFFIRPVFVGANSRKTITLTVTAPEGESFDADCDIAEPVCNPSGEKYRLSQKIMSAVTLTNVVWPIYARRGYILHNTPGRNWDSMYTWDSGFIGMGLSELDIDRAKECLNAYLTPVGDIHSPYIFHGSPVPTQIFLYAEIFAKTSDVGFLREFYPMIRQQYRFFADMRKKETVKKTGMFALWDVFYNSGGWDDYPPQNYVHENGLEESVCPVINTALTVLCGKMLKNIAELLEYDTSEYDEDIEFYSNAINMYAWDEETGYYGYVKNDGSILKIDGINANMGMDGTFPYIAGISNKERTLRIINNIKEGMLTHVGISVVDTRAPYYSNNGYWNGSIWMPHQWILWKACLDNGESEFAWQIARTALDLWESETAYTYNCYEHFMVTSGRGCGFHQFSGLSTPVLMWFNTYFKPYSVTSGFMTVVGNKKISENAIEFSVKSSADKPVVIACMPEGKNYGVKTTGKVTSNYGLYTIEFDGPVSENIVIGI